MWHAFVDMYCVMLYIKLIFNIFIIVGKMCTWCMILRRTWRPTNTTTCSYKYIPMFPMSLSRSQLRFHVGIDCSPITFLNTIHVRSMFNLQIHDPWSNSHVDNVYIFCNFGTPKSPIMFNIVSNVVHTADVPPAT